MSVETPPIFIQSGGETAERARRALGAAFDSRGGIVGSTDLAVTENGTPNMSVNVATGVVVIPGTEGTYQGVYVVENRGALNVAISAADATNPRKDLIVVKVQDAAYSGAVNAASIVAVTGTPAASPAEPAKPNNSWVLAMVDVPASDTAITNAQITDRRTTHSGQTGRASALGGVITCTSTTRPSHVEGRVIYETDTDKVFVSDGSVWTAPKNSAQGALDYVERTTNLTGVSTETDVLTGSAVTLVAGRRYKVSASWTNFSAASASVATLRIKESTTQYAQADNVADTSGRGGGSIFRILDCTSDISAGSHTFKITLARAAGAATVDTNASSTSPITLLVEDIGAS